MTYFFAKLLAELPLNLVPPIFFGLIIYNIPGLDPDRYGHAATLFVVFYFMWSDLCTMLYFGIQKNVQTPAMYDL